MRRPKHDEAGGPAAGRGRGGGAGFTARGVAVNQGSPDRNVGIPPWMILHPWTCRNVRPGSGPACACDRCRCPSTRVHAAVSVSGGTALLRPAWVAVGERFRRKLLSSTRQCFCSQRHTGPHSTAAAPRIGRAWSAVLTPLSVTLDFEMTTSLGLRLCHGRTGFGCPVRRPYRHGVEAVPRAKQVHRRDRRDYLWLQTQDRNVLQRINTRIAEIAHLDTLPGPHRRSDPRQIRCERLRTGKGIVVTAAGLSRQSTAHPAVTSNPPPAGPGSRHRRPPRRDCVGHHRPACLGLSGGAVRRGTDVAKGARARCASSAHRPPVSVGAGRRR